MIAVHLESRFVISMTAGHSRKPFPPGLNEILLDRYFHDGKTNDVAVDYAAQMIQQGRDHGLPPYIKWRSYCDLPNVNEFHDLQETMLSETIDRLQRVYRCESNILLLSFIYNF